MVYYQITPPKPTDHSFHPSLMVDGEPIPCGYMLEILLPTGWRKTLLEAKWNIPGTEGWYFSIDDSINPIGIFCRFK